VSTDIRRLIRVPGSLHGKTALKAVPMDYDTFLSFDPLKDAVAFDDETPVPVNVKKTGVIDLKGKRFTIKSEGRGKLPLFLAIHMFCQGMAEYSA
jgi:DNA primase small subunit